MGATSTPARVSSVASIGNVCISTLYSWSLSIYDQLEYMTHRSDFLLLKVSYAGAHTEISLASTMQARSTDTVRLVWSFFFILPPINI